MDDLVDVFVGRQPIFDKEMQLFAYELLFRENGKDNQAVVLGGDQASAQVMLSAFGDIGLKDVVGEQKAFINFTEGLLNPDYESFFPRKHIVIEVLEDVEVTPKLIHCLKLLRDKGFVIALDDYVFNPELKVLEDFADIIKVDILEVGAKPLIQHCANLKAKGIRLLAEKVETRNQFEYCKKLGFDYFQGYFFAKPKIIQGKRLPTNKLGVLSLLTNVYDPDVDMRKLSDLISQDVSLSEKLLKFASETGRSGHEVTSIHDAVMRFGLERLKSWVSMLMLSGMDDKPVELFKTALTRAKFCELIGSRMQGFSADTYFTVGLFSSLDAIMDSDMQDLLERLNLSMVMRNALLNQEGSLGHALVIVKGIEQGETDFEVPAGLSATELSGLYLKAMQFSKAISV
ncbi:EAL domain-containing protein [Thiomicrorhabdus sp. ZW0627]|uniref:EAL and HDOD domain-containing protein n=1 Tax=Thiomicrorhabdus sp. ZW0627 TaxID=3039774 RepID=UPI002436CFFD|nr:HDOD domain-containing protein [Thiomicrorhabdus sp. ZW0627]MDG6774362.1 EAL domain-containing protein [Thiomicrorhabdus sp. ZW0627]